MESKELANEINEQLDLIANKIIPDLNNKYNEKNIAIDECDEIFDKENVQIDKLDNVILR